MSVVTSLWVVTAQEAYCGSLEYARHRQKTTRTAKNVIATVRTIAGIAIYATLLGNVNATRDVITHAKKVSFRADLVEGAVQKRIAREQESTKRLMPVTTTTVPSRWLEALSLK